MKKLVALLLLTLLVLTCTLTACGDPRPTLQIYTNSGFAPYEYVNEYGEVVGIDIDIAQEIGEALGYNVVINDIDFGMILPEVEKDPFAIGIAGLTQTADRDEVATASVVYATSVQYVIVQKGALDSVVDGNGKVSLAALAGMTIGVQEATTGDFLVSDAIDGATDEEDGSHIEGALEGTNASKLAYANAIIASNDIGTTIDAVVVDKLPALAIANADSKLQAYELDEEPESYVLYFNKEAGELVAQVNALLETLIEKGVIEYFTLKHSGEFAK